MFNKFATAAFAATVSATETEMFQGGSPDGYGIQHGNSFANYGAETGVSGQSYGNGVESYGHKQSFDFARQGRQPSQDIGSLLKQDSSFGGRGVQRSGPSFGHLGGRFGQDGLTYAHDEKLGYGLYQRGNLPKQLRANDGYLVRARTDPHKRYSEPVYAKCNLSDPEEESYISGLVRLQQGAYDEQTSVWATVNGAGYGEINIHALGDLRDGCDSIGEIFNPAVSASGYGRGYEPKSAPGMLGAIGQHGFEGKADVDLSGTWSVIGRSMAVTVGDHRVACCTIGLASGPKRAEPVYVAPVVHQQSYRPQQDYRTERDFGYGQEFLAPRNYH